MQRNQHAPASESPPTPNPISHPHCNLLAPLQSGGPSSPYHKTSETNHVHFPRSTRGQRRQRATFHRTPHPRRKNPLLAECLETWPNRPRGCHRPRRTTRVRRSTRPIPSRRQTPRRHPANSVQPTRSRSLESSPHRPHGSRALRRVVLPGSSKPTRPSSPPPHPHRAMLPPLPQGAQDPANERRYSIEPSRSAPQERPAPLLRKRNCKTNPIRRSARSDRSSIVSQTVLGHPAPGCYRTGSSPDSECNLNSRRNKSSYAK